MYPLGQPDNAGVREFPTKITVQKSFSKGMFTKFPMPAFTFPGSLVIVPFVTRPFHRMFGYTDSSYNLSYPKTDCNILEPFFGLFCH
jgi:hypothetical protein